MTMNLNELLPGALLGKSSLFFLAVFKRFSTGKIISETHARISKRFPPIVTRAVTKSILEAIYRRVKSASLFLSVEILTAILILDLN